MSNVVVGDCVRGRDDLARWTCNVVKSTGVTCRACGEPTIRAEHCRHCAQHRTIPKTADVVAPVLYAIAGTPSAALLRDYKDHPSRAIRAQSARIVGHVVETALSRHTSCVETAAGEPITVRTTLPSLTFRPGVHPLMQVARDARVDVQDVLSAALTATCHRIVRPDKFEVRRPDAIVGAHVLLLDDVWTTGSNAQSAALMLRRAGAKTVSVMVVGRWINPAYPPVTQFLERHGCPGFDPTVCPVTGGTCP